MTTRPTNDELTALALDPDTQLRRIGPGGSLDVYRRLRTEAPLVWAPEPGVWLASRHAEVLAISTDSARFCSGEGILPLEIGWSYPTPPTMMHTDAPLHTAYRHLLSPAFRPSRMRALDAQIREVAQRFVGDLPIGAPVDFVRSLAIPFPLYVIAALLGIPTERWEQFYDWSEATIPDVGDLSAEDRQAAVAEMGAYLLQVAAERRAHPEDDLISVLATAEFVDPDGDGSGRLLADSEMSMFLDQLLVAGNETTRNLISGAVVALAQNPDQWDLLRSDRDAHMAGVIDESLRWTAPVVGFMRTAVEATELSGQRIEAGDPIWMLYASANFDESVFGPDADQFCIDRIPNPHLSFGFGAHFCLGAALGRLELAAVLDAMLDRFTTIELAEEPRLTSSTIIAGVRHASLVLSA